MSLPPIVASESELMDLVLHHSGTVIGMVTPELAAVLLRLNTGNRPLQRSGVARFKRILQTGKWLNTSEPIIVSAEGVLNDGQHRLTAIVETGISAPLDVRFGIARETFTSIGAGQRRTPGDVLHILGASAAATQAALARLLILHKAGKLGQKEIIEPDEIVAVYEGDPVLAEIAVAIQSTKFAPTRTAAFGFPLVLAARISALEKVKRFIELASTGLTTSPNDPARVLYVRLGEARMRKHRIPQIAVSTITARAWNAWADGREIKQLTVRPGDETGKNFPEIVPCKTEL